MAGGDFKVEIVYGGRSRERPLTNYRMWLHAKTKRQRMEHRLEDALSRGVNTQGLVRRLEELLDAEERALAVVYAEQTGSANGLPEESWEPDEEQDASRLSLDRFNLEDWQHRRLNLLANGYETFLNVKETRLRGPGPGLTALTDQHLIHALEPISPTPAQWVVPLTEVRSIDLRRERLRVVGFEVSTGGSGLVFECSRDVAESLVSAYEFR